MEKAKQVAMRALGRLRQGRKSKALWGWWEKKETGKMDKERDGWEREREKAGEEREGERARREREREEGEREREGLSHVAEAERGRWEEERGLWEKERGGLVARGEGLERITQERNCLQDEVTSATLTGPKP